MKSHNNLIILSTFLFITFILLCPVDVYAGSLEWGGVNIECIYEDGGAYSSNTQMRKRGAICPSEQILKDKSCLVNGKFTEKCEAKNSTDILMDGSWSELAGNILSDLIANVERCIGKAPGEEITYSVPYYSTNRMTYNLRGVSNQASATTGNTEFVTIPFSGNKCRSHLRRGYVTDEDDDDNETTTTYYNFGNSKDDIEFHESDFDGVGFWTAWFGGGLTDEEMLEQAEDTQEDFDLVSERYILTDEAGEPDFTLTYRQESEQAAGSDNYAYIMVYSNAVILKTQSKTTLLETTHFDGVSVNDNNEVIGLSSKDVIFLNNPEANSYQDSSSVTSYYYQPGQVRYTISITRTPENSRKFVLFNVGLGSGNTIDSELCDSIMPNTSKVLKRVIQIAQIVVPVLLIGLVAFDIGKIVVAGNLEEELPKQKKKIIARIIVAIVFFFLPLITMLLIDLIKETGFVNGEDIKQIECLFIP